MDLRIPFNKGIEIKTVLINSRFVELPKPIKVTTINLRCSGVLLSTNLDLPNEVCFCVEFLLNDEIISTICAVIRKEQSEEGLWNYGCKFLQTEEMSNSKIRRFVFEQQTKFRIHATRT